MKKPPSQRQLRVPVQFVDGVWESVYGGIVPVKPNTQAELILDRSAISDPGFLARMEEKGRYKVVEQGTTLLVMLNVKSAFTLSKPHLDVLIPADRFDGVIVRDPSDSWHPAFLHLVRVRLGKPTEAQLKSYDEANGGLWLLTHGPEAVGLQSTSIMLPWSVWPKPVQSLNHAYTKLSEVYEPWRLSHTGNIYSRVLYQEADDRWYPLDFLRNAALAQNEQKIALNLWNDFMAKMSFTLTREEN